MKRVGMSSAYDDLARRHNRLPTRPEAIEGPRPVAIPRLSDLAVLISVLAIGLSTLALVVSL